MANYYRNEKEKMKRRQERGFPIFIAFIIIAIIMGIISA